MRKTVCVDFNGVLDQYRGWNGPGTEYIYEPRPGVEQFLQALRARGYEVVVLTAANPDMVYKWLRRYRLSNLVNRVTCIKPPAYAYIDDRAIHFRGDYEAALQELDGFKSYWEED